MQPIRRKLVSLSGASAWAMLLVAWALSSPHAATPGAERVLVAIWCVEEDLGRCAPPLTSDADGVPTRLVPADLLTRDCFAGAPERSAECLAEESSALARSVDVPLRLLADRPDVPEGRDGGPALYLRAQSTFVTGDVDASLARMRILNLLVAVLLPAGVFALASHRTRRAMAASGLLLVPLGLTLVTSIDTTAWTLTGALVTWAATLTALEPGAAWRRALAMLAAIVGGVVLLTPVSADPMRTGAFLVLSLALAVGLRALDGRSNAAFTPRLVTAVGTAVAGIALWRTFRPVPWDRGLLDAERPLLTLLRLPAAVGDVIGRGVGLGHGDTVVSEWVGAVVLVVALTVMLRGLLRAQGWGRALALAVGAFGAMQATHVVVLPGATMDAGLFTGRHFLPLGLLAVAAAVAVGGVTASHSGGSGLLSASARGTHRASQGAAVILALAHATALHTQVQRHVADADARGLWPVEDGWWWDLPFGPGVVWVAGSLAFLALVLAAVPLVVEADGWRPMRPRRVRVHR